MSKREPDAADREATDEAFLQRWSRLKSATRDAGKPADRPDDAQQPPGAIEAQDAAPRSTELTGPAAVALPDLDSLGPDSDYSAFLRPDVDVSLRRNALRKLFHSPKFNVHDGLDDYCGDFTQFAPLAGIVTADMRHHAERVVRELMSADAAHGPQSKSADAPVTPPQDAGTAARTTAREPNHGAAAAPGTVSGDTAVPDIEESREDAGHGPA